MRIPLLVLAVLAVVAVPALGANRGPTRAQRAAARVVIRHCVGGQSLARDRTPALLLARRTLPSDIAEYTDCADRIARALRARGYVRPRGRDRVAAVRADCARGYIGHRFARATLLRTRRNLRPSESACRRLVRRELRR